MENKDKLCRCIASLDGNDADYYKLKNIIKEQLMHGRLNDKNYKEEKDKTFRFLEPTQEIQDILKESGFDLKKCYWE
jgi:hypothetical protein